MVIRSVFTLSLLLVLMVGCTATIPVVDTVKKQTGLVASSVSAQDSAINKIIREPIRVTRCRITQRDLTMDWQSREYLCSHDQRIGLLQEHNAAVFYGHSRRYKPLSVVKSATDKAIVTPVEDMISVPTEGAVDDCDSLTCRPRMDKCRARQDADSDPTLSRGERELLKQPTVRIPFARNREVLGTKGTERSLSLIPAVKGAHRVTLRGIYEHTEITDPTPMNQERFSVGRALSVRKLWSDKGVDSAKVTILHHRNDLAGRYVEVIFHDQ